MGLSLVGAFDRAARATSSVAGRGESFGAAALLIIIWLITGPIFGWSDSWQLVINTGTTIVTFLMVFLLQCTQNRDTKAMQVKLDELIRVTADASNTLIGLEHKPEVVIDAAQRSSQRGR